MTENIIGSYKVDLKSIKKQRQTLIQSLIETAYFSVLFDKRRAINMIKLIPIFHGVMALVLAGLWGSQIVVLPAKHPVPHPGAENAADPKTVTITSLNGSGKR